jgi:hypothetical protein
MKILDFRIAQMGLLDRQLFKALKLSSKKRWWTGLLPDT